MDHIEVMLSTWNGATWLQPQLESLTAQTGAGRITLSVRDDGSTDETWGMLERFAEGIRTSLYSSPTFDPQPAEPLSSEPQLCNPPASPHTTSTPSSTASPTSTPLSSPSPTPTPPSPFEVRLHRGTNLGFIASFFTLLLRSDPHADWFAFCDQDDIWQPDKLARAMEQLRQETANIPLLYASRLTLVDESLHEIGQSGVPARGPAFANAVVENIVTGATLVMNRAARNLLLEGLDHMTGISAGPDAEVPKAAVEGVRLHDWWCYLVVSAFGRVVYDSESRILYRQHGGNQVGWRPSFWARQAQRLKRLRRQGDMRAITRQAALFAQVHGEALEPEKSHMLERFLAKDRQLGARIACVIHPGVWRQRRMDGLLLRLLLLTGRI